LNQGFSRIISSRERGPQVGATNEEMQHEDRGHRHPCPSQPAHRPDAVRGVAEALRAVILTARRQGS
jgi:hypothetical protein